MSPARQPPQICLGATEQKSFVNFHGEHVDALQSHQWSTDRNPTSARFPPFPHSRLDVALALACSSSPRSGQAQGGLPAATDGASSDAGTGGTPEAGSGVPWDVEHSRRRRARRQPDHAGEDRRSVSLLFYDPICIDHQTSCATCHSEVWGMSDGLAAIRRQRCGSRRRAGSYRPNMIRRNAPTLWNVAFRET